MSKLIKKSKLVEILEDCQLAYAEVLERIFNCYTHDDDGGCNQEATGEKRVFKVNDIMLIYQPMGDEPWWVENACILMMPTKESGIKLTKAMFNKAKPLFDEVEKKLIDSVNGFISKYNGWIEPFGESKIDFKKITGIFEPINFDEKSGKIKIKWELKTLYETPSRWWNPVELINWKYSLPRYAVYRENRIRENIKRVEDIIQENLKTALKYKEELYLLKSDDPKYKELSDKIERTNEWISFKTSQIEELEKEIHIPPEPYKNYIDCDDDEYLKEWYSNEGKGHKRSSLVTYEDAFSIAEPLSGKKRGSDEESTMTSNKKSKK
jgi:hypothetical protein